MPWKNPKHEAIQSFDHVDLQGYVTNKNLYIPTTKSAYRNQLARMMTYLDGLLPIKSRDLIYKVTWPLKQLYVQ